MAADSTKFDAEPYFTNRKDLDGYSVLAPASFGSSKLVAAHYRRDRPDLGMTMPNDRTDTLMAVVNLQPHGGNEIWCEGRAGRRAAMPRGGLAVLDHRLAWSTQIIEPFETVHIFFDVNEFMKPSEGFIPATDTLDCSIEELRHDPTMLHLALALLPMIENPEQVSTLFADHIYEAIRLHLAVTYGGLAAPEPQLGGGLNVRQRRLVNELIQGSLVGETKLADLSNACGVSTRHFVRAFKATYGVAPYQWLMAQRVERGKQLLEHTDGSICDIALECGFADQSHFTRVFLSAVGATPGVWRRLRKI